MLFYIGALRIRGAFTILATEAGQVLFFIDSFERVFDRAGTLRPLPIFSLPAREDRTDETNEESKVMREERKGRSQQDDGENGKSALRDQGRRQYLIEIVYR